MSAPEPAPCHHIHEDRLREVAIFDNLIFTDAEFGHVQACPRCFKLWKQLILDNWEVSK